MALAILELLALDTRNVVFRVDTGTNRYYCLKIGRSTRRRAGIDWVDDVSYVTPVAVNHVGGSLLNTWTELSVPATRFQKGNVHAQLFTFKTADGISPAFSRVVTAPVGMRLPTDAPAFSGPAAMPSTVATDAFLPARAVPCRTYADAYARSASWDDLLAGLVKVAAPVVLNLLAGSGQHPAQKNGSAQPAGSPTNAPQANLLALLLNMLLGGSTSGATSPAVSQSLSATAAVLQENRFLHPEPGHLSQTFFWPALLTAIAPALVQILPQLMNAANQRRIQLKQADDKLVTDLLSEVDRRMLLDKLLEAQRQAPAGGGAANPSSDLNALIQLLQQMPTASEAPAAASAPAPAASSPAPPAATSASLSLSTNGVALSTSTLSSKAVVTFVTAPPIAWNGTPTVLFAKNRPLQLKVRLTVAEPAPKSALPKAIIKITFKGGTNQSVWAEKTFKQKDVLAGGVISLSFSPDELAHLPTNQVITAFAEMRWLTPNSGREYRALGSLELVLVDTYFLKEIGKASGPERELTDMQRFRPFWNKVWEAPTLQLSGGGQDDKKQYTWQLDATTKYTVLLSADQPANGLMQTKLLRRPPDPDSLTDRTEGRMKAGIELSIAELNKLLALWDGHPALEPGKLAAIATDSFARNNAGECIDNLKLKGRAGQRGMIWVVPVFKLVDVSLGVLQSTDDSGQVLAAGEEKVQFPLPAAARVIGLTSQDGNDSAAADGESEYAFDGFTVEFSDKIMLTPLGQQDTVPARS